MFHEPPHLVICSNLGILKKILTYHFDDDDDGDDKFQDKDDDDEGGDDDDDDEDKKKVGLVSALVWFSLPVRQTLQI